MKICIVSTDYPSEGRPAYVFVQQLVHQLLRQGTEVVVIAPQSLTHSLIHRKPLRPKVNTVVTADGIPYRVYRPYYLSVGDHYPRLTRCLDIYRSMCIEQIIRKERPNVLYAHFWENAEVIDGIARKLDLPLFVACGEGDNALEMMVERMTDERKSQLARTVTGMISVSSENKRKCLAYGLCREDNVTVLPNCVDTLQFRPDRSLSLRTELGIGDEDFVVIFCGAFIRRKGARRVAEAIKLLQDESIKSIFVGKPFDGEDETPDCPNIVFRGSVAHDELPKYLNSADLFVLPTQKEGCCNAIVEALACSLPVVSSDGPFNDDILNETNSIRVNPDDIEAIAEAIRVYKNNNELRQRATASLLASQDSYSLAMRARRITDYIETMTHNVPQ